MARPPPGEDGRRDIASEGEKRKGQSEELGLVAKQGGAVCCFAQTPGLLLLSVVAVSCLFVW